MKTWSCFTYGHWNGIKHTHCFFPWVSHNLHFRTEGGAEAVGSEIIERSIHMNFSLSQKRHHMLITTTTEQHAVDWKDLWINWTAPALHWAPAGDGDHCRLGLHMVSDTSPSSCEPPGQDRDTLSPIWYAALVGTAITSLLSVGKSHVEPETKS